MPSHSFLGGPVERQNEVLDKRLRNELRRLPAGGDSLDYVRREKRQRQQIINVAPADSGARGQRAQGCHSTLAQLIEPIAGARDRLSNAGSTVAAEP